MKKSFFVLSVSFFILLVTNITWAVITLYLGAVYGFEFIMHGKNLLESIDTSVYLRWILVVDGVWLVFATIFMLQRKKYKTDPNLHYLRYEPITKPSVCVVIPAYNESASIEKVVKDYINQKFVNCVIVIDNNSDDDTVKLAENAGAQVLKKQENRGYAHSYVLGLIEAIKTDSNIIVTTEADGTFNAYDIAKMIPYLDNCDMVIGTRQIQILTEKGNQNSIIHVWGNLILAKLIQFKYFNLHHLGFVNLTDVGCLFRSIRREALEKIIGKLTYPGTDNAIGGNAFALYLTMLGIENDLSIVEIPVSFNRRVGFSKTGSNQMLKGIRMGLGFLWFILIS